MVSLEIYLNCPTLANSVSQAVTGRNGAENADDVLIHIYIQDSRSVCKDFAARGRGSWSSQWRFMSRCSWTHNSTSGTPWTWRRPPVARRGIFLHSGGQVGDHSPRLPHGPTQPLPLGGGDPEPLAGTHQPSIRGIPPPDLPTPPWGGSPTLRAWLGAG